MEHPAVLGWSNNVKGEYFAVHNIHELVDVVRKKPGLFIGDLSVSMLHSFLQTFVRHPAHGTWLARAVGRALR